MGAQGPAFRGKRGVCGKFACLFVGLEFGSEGFGTEEVPVCWSGFAELDSFEPQGEGLLDVGRGCKDPGPEARPVGGPERVG